MECLTWAERNACSKGGLISGSAPSSRSSHAENNVVNNLRSWRLEIPQQEQTLQIAPGIQVCRKMASNDQGLGRIITISTRQRINTPRCKKNTRINSNPVTKRLCGMTFDLDCSASQHVHRRGTNLYTYCSIPNGQGDEKIGQYRRSS